MCCLRYDVEISHFEFAGMYSLNVIHIRVVIMESFHSEMRNKAYKQPTGT